MLILHAIAMVRVALMMEHVIAIISIMESIAQVSKTKHTYLES